MLPDLIAASFSVLRKHKPLILFPILGAIAALLVAAAFAGFGGLFSSAGRSRDLGVTAYPILFLGYLLCAFGVIFFNCALAACAQECLAGGDPTIGFGLRRALGRTGTIFVWAAIYSTVGILLRVIERLVPLAGRIAIWLFGAAWGMATYLVVPVLILENRNAVDSIHRSSQLLRDTWGPQLTASIRLSWRFLLFAIPGVVVGAIGMNYYRPLVALAIVYLVALVTALFAANGIFEVALYRYAAGDSAHADWPHDAMTSAFRPAR
ncbi:MAG: DUF6159 family protein [Bryobacteraceae bacterium]|jgi:hypothetical protein